MAPRCWFVLLTSLGIAVLLRICCILLMRRAVVVVLLASRFASVLMGRIVLRPAPAVLVRWLAVVRCLPVLVWPVTSRSSVTTGL
jgi:hypothetical protein